MECRKLIDKLNLEKHLDFPEWVTLWSSYTGDDRLYAGELARSIALKHYGKNVYIRGIVEFSNRCGNDCFYCGIRKSNDKVQRYTLSDDVILDCCETGYQNGIRTFVLQSGEAVELDLEHLCDLVRSIKSRFDDCAVTLSLGELSFDEYARLREAGAEVLGIVSIYTYGMKKGLDRLAEAQVKNVSLTNFDTVVQVAAEEGYIKQEDVPRLIQFRNNPSDESWIGEAK